MNDVIEKVRLVRTPAGAKRFGQPIGSVIVADRVLRNIAVNLEPGYKDVVKYDGADGNDYYVAPYPGKPGSWVAVDGEDYLVAEGKSEDAVTAALDRFVASEMKAKRQAAPKPAPAPKAASGTKAWQRPWSSLSKEEQDKIRSMRGQVPQINPLTKKPWTAQAIKKKRQGRTAEDMIRRAQANGWRLITSDDERHEVGRLSGKPIPPGWSHVFVYEGPDADKRAYTIQGLDWSYKMQPHQTAAKRSESLDKKFTRYRELGKHWPRLDRQTKKDTISGDDVGLVVRLMMLTGGRVDSSDGESTTGSRGITSLQRQHVKVRGDVVSIEFFGKSARTNVYQFRDKAAADALREMLAEPGKPTDDLFPAVTSARTGEYIKTHAGPDFINHDIRTFVANNELQRLLTEYEYDYDKNDPKSVARLVKEVSEEVGDRINDSGSVAYSAYTDPLLWQTLLDVPADMLPERKGR